MICNSEHMLQPVEGILVYKTNDSAFIYAIWNSARSAAQTIFPSEKPRRTQHAMSILTLAVQSKTGLHIKWNLSM
jgi:hypothetical protein